MSTEAEGNKYAKFLHSQHSQESDLPIWLIP